MQELLRGAGQLQILCGTVEFLPGLQNFFLRRLILKAHEHRAHVAVRDRHTQALGRKAGRLGRDDLVALDVAPQLQRLLLALFLLAADVGDDVVEDVGEGLKRLACTGDGLIGADEHVRDAVFAQGMQGRHIALQAAVGLDGHKAALGAQALALGRDDVDVVGVDLGYDHRYVRGKAVRAVVGHDRALGLGIGLLQCLDLVLLHVDGAKDEIDLGGDLLHIGGVQHDHLFNALGHGGLHQPAAADGLLIGFASAACAGRKGNQIKPGVTFQQRSKALADHTGCTDNTNIVLFHPD